MTPYNIALVIIGLLVLGIGLFSKSLRNRLYLSEPICALVLGVFSGPVVFDVVSPDKWHVTRIVIEEVTRITLAVGLVGVALRIPPVFLKHYWKTVGWRFFFSCPLCGLLVACCSGGRFLFRFGLQ